MPVSTRGRLAAVLSPLVTTILAVLVMSLGSTLLTGPPASAAGHRHATRWDCLAHYESGNRWAARTGNGYYGGLQFSVRTWLGYGGQRYSGNHWPNKATRREQIRIARRVAFRGWRHQRPQGGRSAWPSTWGRCF
jgi:hypothetical protein